MGIHNLNTQKGRNAYVEAMSKKEFHVTIMSIDPNDHEGREAGDDHQKYGLRVSANNDKEAEKLGVEQFKRQHGGLPIFWVKVISM